MGAHDPVVDDAIAPQVPYTTRRGEPVGDYHDQTLIPPSDPTIKPMPPRTSDHTKFTDEDRIFFIHYLRWRLYDGEVPTKNELYEELATEVSAPPAGDGRYMRLPTNHVGADSCHITAPMHGKSTG